MTKNQLLERFNKIKEATESGFTFTSKNTKYLKNALSFITLGGDFLQNKFLQEANNCAKEANILLDMVKTPSDSYNDAKTKYQELVERIGLLDSSAIGGKIRKDAEIIHTIQEIDFSNVEKNDATVQIRNYLETLSYIKSEINPNDDISAQNASYIIRLRKEVSDLYNKSKIIEKELQVALFLASIANERSQTKLNKMETLLMEKVAENLEFRRKIMQQSLNQNS